MIETFEIVAKALADRSRLRLLALLEGGEVCVCHLTEVLGLAPATVSKHLSLLKAAGLVRARKDGRWVHYRLNETPPPAAAALLAVVRDQLAEDAQVAADRAAPLRTAAPPSCQE